eukprot:7090747-Alexandrium_andersonii.AAC.1
MQIQAPEAPREARDLRRLALRAGGRRPVRRFRVAERAVRPVGRSGTAASSGRVWGQPSYFDQRVRGHF